MSKWGYVSEDSAKQKFESNPDTAAKMVGDMSMVLIDQEKEIDSLKSELLTERTKLMGAQASEAHMRGYIERVRELDEKPDD